VDSHYFAHVIIGIISAEGGSFSGGRDYSCNYYCSTNRTSS